MARRLEMAAPRGRCLHGNHSSDLWGSGGSGAGIHREYLFDFTWYSEWKSWELPTVVIEHENSWSMNEFLFDLWKLMMAGSGLRVMIGYRRASVMPESYLEAIHSASLAGGWRFPLGTEDLVLLGHGRMGPRGFHVFHRPAGQERWVDRGSLDESIGG